MTRSDYNCWHDMVTVKSIARLIAALEKDAKLEPNTDPGASSHGYVVACAAKAAAEHYLRILNGGSSSE